MMKPLPVYKMVMDDSLEDTTGVNALAITKTPAIERNFVKYSQQAGVSLDVHHTHVSFKADEKNDRRIVTGAAIVPNKLVYRNDDELGEYYTYVDAEGTFQMMRKYFRTSSHLNLNKEHEASRAVPGMELFECIYVDSSRGVSAPFNEQVPDGTIFLSFYVSDNKIWDEICKGVFRGYSIEGLFNMVQEPVGQKHRALTIEQIIDETLSAY